MDIRFIINSDAHSPEHVGDMKNAESLINGAGIDPARIANLRKR